MFQGLKVFLRKQRKLVLIFLLTIFLPSVTLSIFGYIALRTERYRLEKQLREEQLDFVDDIKSNIKQNILELGNELQQHVRTPSFVNKVYPEMNTLIEQNIVSNPLAGQFFLVFNDKESWFPPFRGKGSGYPAAQVKGYTNAQKTKVEEAENFEFSQHNFPAAISILEELLKDTEDRNLKGQLLSLLARNYMKQNNLSAAISIYTEIIENYSNSRTPSGMMLQITVRFQLIDCYLRSGLKKEAVKETIRAFEETLRNSTYLSEDQLSTYVAMAREKFSVIRKEYPDIFSSDAYYVNDFENLITLYENSVSRWRVIKILKEECIPDISPDLMHKNQYLDHVLRYSKKIGDEDFLILTSPIPDISGTRTQGIAGITINGAFLKDSLLPDIILNAREDADESPSVTDLSGRLIYGNETYGEDANGIQSFFDDNFPPWRIELSGNQSRSFLITDLFKSYYFWTILAMMAILVFGVVIIGRMIAHEKEVLKLKSEFVSSVSHEFKTPITSIKALSERLLEGSVKDQKRMLEYYKVISQDAESLSHLVGNILDFSKMEEGKKEYIFEETNLKAWMEDTLKLFFSRVPERNYKFQTSMDEPSVPVSIDRSAMKLAINNLLDNAVKFSSPPAAINVSLEKQQRHYHLNIMDEGIGIPANEQSKIFEKFYHGKYATNHASTGTGLGLAIVKQIVEAHGGEVRVESEPGSGSTFVVSLPIETQSEA